MSSEAREAMRKPKFYSDAKTYWDSIDATVDGMLGGFSSLSPIDASSSTKFLQRYLERDGPYRVLGGRALDCGAGIGRVAKHTLLPLFKTCDLVELSQSFLDRAPAYLGPEKAGRVERRICCGLQDFVPEPGRYDVIWTQWVLGHLTDDDLVGFFRRCQTGLTVSGMICVKENVTRKGVDLDPTDSSVTRSAKLLRRIFEESGLAILHEEEQENFPQDIYAVKMFALVPNKRVESNKTLSVKKPEN